MFNVSLHVCAAALYDNLTGCSADLQIVVYSSVYSNMRLPLDCNTKMFMSHAFYKICTWQQW